MKARYQNSATGRFISQDPLVRDNPMEFLADPQQLNSYNYARNNPVYYVDPSGLYNIKTGEVEKGDTLNNITTQINDTYNTSYSYNDIAKLNNISNPVKIEVNQIIIPNQETPDITVDLTNRMHKNVADPKIKNPFYFKNKVKSGGEWDFKYEDNSQYCSVSECGGLQHENYVFRGEEARWDSPSNIHYGYVGSNTWYGSPNVLHYFAGTAHNQDNDSTKGDDLSDAYYIDMGINLFLSDY